MREETTESLRALIEVVDRLRAPGGCPWDREQTHASLRPFLLEETYELLEAIDGGEAAAIREELGDVLLQVLMHCAIAAEAADAGFDVGDVAETTRAKMIHRHPHVFADVEVEGAAEVVVNWERLKRTEKGGRLSLLDGIPAGLPALAFAQGVQKRPARLGFDETPTTEDALSSLQGSVAELAEAAAAPAPSPRGLEDAMGDLLFTAVALARRLRLNPEDALRARTLRFVDRFRALEQRARSEGADLHDLAGAEWERRWEEAPAPR